MARHLSNQPSLMLFKDNLSGSELGLFYRMPTTEERVAYRSRKVKKENGEVADETVSCRIHSALNICMGVREKDFTIPGPAEAAVFISSDPQSPDYVKNWKEMLMIYASDLLELMAVAVFDTPVNLLSRNASAPAKDGGPDPNLTTTSPQSGGDSAPQQTGPSAKKSTEPEATS